MDETSLDDFLDSEADGETAHEADDAESSREDDAEDPAAVEPAATTYQWTPAGATCAACGERTKRRWHSDDGLVCPDCKAW